MSKQLFHLNRLLMCVGCLAWAYWLLSANPSDLVSSFVAWILIGGGAGGLLGQSAKGAFVGAIVALLLVGYGVIAFHPGD